MWQTAFQLNFHQLWQVVDYCQTRSDSYQFPRWTFECYIENYPSRRNIQVLKIGHQSKRFSIAKVYTCIILNLRWRVPKISAHFIDSYLLDTLPSIHFYSQLMHLHFMGVLMSALIYKCFFIVHTGCKILQKLVTEATNNLSFPYDYIGLWHTSMWSGVPVK